jgi:hypothetical protein
MRATLPERPSTWMAAPWQTFRDLAITKIPVMISSYCQTGGIEYEDIDCESERHIARNGRFDCSFG